MKRLPLLVVCQCGLLAGALFADIVTLKDGRQISGTVESGNTQELHVKVGGQPQTLDIHDVAGIRFATSAKAAGAAPATSGAPNHLFLNDGTQVTGRWWSLDATNLHFLIDNQLQHYPRQDVVGVTFGDATLPPLPERSTPPPAAVAPPPSSVAAPPAHAPTLMRPSANAPSGRPTLARPSESAAPPAPTRTVSQPNQIGAVYFWNGKDLTPLEVTQAVQHGNGSKQYWEMAGPKSRVRVEEATSLVFILRLPPGVDPASYSLFSLDTVNGARRTRNQPGRGGGLATWPVGIQINDQSSLMTYALTVRDLPAGEYSFSPSSSNDGYCFGVDPSTPGQ